MIHKTLLCEVNLHVLVFVQQEFNCDVTKEGQYMCSRIYSLQHQACTVSAVLTQRYERRFVQKSLDVHVCTF
jgi:hypothetical protein